jgi:hypothetical protein
MNGNTFSLVRRALLAGILSVVATLLFTVPSFGAGQGLLSGGTEDATVQIACGNPAFLQTHPITFTANYQNGSQTASYDHNTSECPIRDFAGELLRGPQGAGNMASVTIGGQVIRRNEPERTVGVKYSDGTSIIIIITVYDYSGRLYVEITVLA